MTSALKILDPSVPHTFARPSKKINDVPDVAHFLSSQAYADIVTFLFQLNVSVFPRRIILKDGNRPTVRAWDCGSIEDELSPEVKRLRELLRKLEAIIDEAPPDSGPRRFGNVSFKKWYTIVEERMPELLDEHLPELVLSFSIASSEGQENGGTANNAAVTAKDEVAGYFIGSFGSAQRLDYGTGHELSFLAFLAVLWKLGAFHAGGHQDGNTTQEDRSKDQLQNAGEQERGIVLGLMVPYFQLVRRLIKTYTLEPAGSHGVWGLDDHFFLPYIFGSAQYCPAITSVQDQLPSEGSVSKAPDPSDISNAKVVERERTKNMYFGAIGFIIDVKNGPFWEHSRVLYDISGVKDGWAKINKGMLKMYNAEVLSKFPVVQHFPFGEILSWEGLAQDAAAGQHGDGGTAQNDTISMGLATVIQQSSQHASSLPSLNPASSLNPAIVPTATMTTSMPPPTAFPRTTAATTTSHIPSISSRQTQSIGTSMPGAGSHDTSMPRAATAHPSTSFPSTVRPGAHLPSASSASSAGPEKHEQESRLLRESIRPTPPPHPPVPSFNLAQQSDNAASARSASANASTTSTESISGTPPLGSVQGRAASALQNNDTATEQSKGA